MFINNKMFFNKRVEVKEARGLLDEFQEAKDNGDAGKAQLKFQDICRVMKERVEDNYASPMRTFLRYTGTQDHREQHGFIIMGINCILIEFYYEMSNGYDQTTSNGGTVQLAYTTILPQLDNAITIDEAIIFYKGVRCGIIHQGQTKEDTAITFEYNKIIEKNGPYYLCNPQILFDKLQELYKKYWEVLSIKKYNEAESELLVGKMKLILDHIS